jgi:hypothetical protein
VLTLKGFIRDFSAENQLELNIDALQYIDSAQSKFKLLSCLYACWYQNGLVDDAETGCGASALLRPVVNNFLDLMIREHWHIESVIYNGEEESALLVLENKNQQVTLDFDGFCGDWIPESVLEKMQKFTHDKGEKTVAIFCSEDSLFLMLPLSHQAYQQLQLEIENFFCIK